MSLASERIQYIKILEGLPDSLIIQIDKSKIYSDDSQGFAELKLFKIRESQYATLWADRPNAKYGIWLPNRVIVASIGNYTTISHSFTFDEKQKATLKKYIERYNPEPTESEPPVRKTKPNYTRFGYSLSVGSNFTLYLSKQIYDYHLPDELLPCPVVVDSDTEKALFIKSPKGSVFDSALWIPKYCLKPHEEGYTIDSTVILSMKQKQIFALKQILLFSHREELK